MGNDQNEPHAYASPKSDLGTGDREQGAEARQWAMFAHLASFAGYLIPFGNIIGPLVVWMLKKDQHPFVDQHGKESLNFQISMTIWIAMHVLGSSDATAEAAAALLSDTR